MLSGECLQLPLERIEPRDPVPEILVAFVGHALQLLRDLWTGGSSGATGPAPVEGMAMRWCNPLDLPSPGRGGGPAGEAADGRTGEARSSRFRGVASAPIPRFKAADNL